MFEEVNEEVWVDLKRHCSMIVTCYDFVSER